MNTLCKLLESVQPTTILGLCDEKFTNESFMLQPVSETFIFKQVYIGLRLGFWKKTLRLSLPQ